jgi:stage V sporulation protein G
MEITEVRITLRDEPKLKAFVNVTFDDCFVVRGLKVIEGSNGFFISMPSRKGKDGTYRDIAHPINNETREMMESIIIDKYKEELSKQGMGKEELEVPPEMPEGGEATT